jgi:DnaJ family protein C protein 7
VEHYTAALLSNTESLHFSAICFGNRAAAYQAMGHILDAIADCSLAIALDTTYCKVGERSPSSIKLKFNHVHNFYLDSGQKYPYDAVL